MKNFTLIALCAMLFSTGSLVAQSPIFTEGYASGVSYVPFGGSTNNPSEDATVAYSGTKSLKIDVPAGNYTGGSLVAATTQNLSSYNAVSFWVKASAVKTLNVAGLGNDAVGGNVYQSEYNAIPLTTTWTKVIIPIPNPAKFTAVVGLFHFAEGSDEGAYTIWMDDIQYETTTVGTATATVNAQSFTKGIGEMFTVNSGGACAFTGVTGASFNINSAYFTYASANNAVATMNGATGVGTAVAGGTTTITATLGAVTATGGPISVTVTAAPTGPTVAASTPTKLAADVISLFSNAYTNNPTDTWRTGWSSGGALTDLQVAGNDTKKYENINYAGVTFEGSSKIDATLMTNFHLDMWTLDPTTAGFKVKLVDFGADGNYAGGDDTESGEIALTTPGGPSSWSSYDLPLSAFVGLASRAHLAQMVVISGGKTIWIDNVYFYKTAPPAVPMVAAPTPTNPIPNVISLFSGAYTNKPIDTWLTPWSAGTLEDVMIAGNATKKYTLADFIGVEFTAANMINATAATHMHIDVWTSITANADFKIKLVDFGANGVYNGPGMVDDKEHEISLTPAGGSWVPYDIPFTAFTGLTTRGNLAQLIFKSTSVVARALAPPVFYVDNIYFYAGTPLAVELTNLTAKSVNKTTVLNWQTASEKDNQGFTVERSLNGTDYAAIGQVKGFGTTNTVRNYAFTDATPTNGVNYYRLRQADFNGKETLSKVVSVISGKNFLVLKNTLVQNLLDVTVGEETKGPLSIFNVSGQLVYSAKVQGNQLLDVSALTSGLYIVRTEAGDVSRFVKQ
jgi:hypothetical protein